MDQPPRLGTGVGSLRHIATRHRVAQGARHAAPPGSGPGRNKDADDALPSTPACPHTCVHAVVLRFTTRKILWHHRRAMLRGHGELRHASCLGLLCEGPALNGCTVFRMTAFIGIPIVRFRTLQQSGNACGDDEACACPRQIGRSSSRQTWHRMLKTRIAAHSGLHLEQTSRTLVPENLLAFPVEAVPDNRKRGKACLESVRVRQESWPRSRGGDKGQHVTFLRSSY